MVSGRVVACAPLPTGATAHDFTDAMIAMGMTTTMKSAKEIHKGDHTHHQDQSMYPISFKAMNTTVRRPGNPMPPADDEDEFSLMIYPSETKATATKLRQGDVPLVTVAHSAPNEPAAELIL